MPVIGRKTPAWVLRTWLLFGVVFLAFVSSCKAESNDVEGVAEELKELSIEEIREDLIDELLQDLLNNAQLMMRERPNANLLNLVSSWQSARPKKAFFGANQLTNMKSGFHKKSSADDSDMWDTQAEDKRGRSIFHNQLTRLDGGFHKRSDGEESKRGRAAFGSQLTNLASGFTKRDDSGLFEEGKRRGSAFLGANHLTNLKSGFVKREDDEAAQKEAAKRGRAPFRNQLTNLASGFTKRNDEETGLFNDVKRGRSIFSGASRLTNLGSGFKRDGNFNTGPMIHIPSGFVQKRSVRKRSVQTPEAL